MHPDPSQINFYITNEVGENSMTLGGAYFSGLNCPARVIKTKLQYFYSGTVEYFDFDNVVIG